jgi:hypothetical protein
MTVETEVLKVLGFVKPKTEKDIPVFARGEKTARGRTTGGSRRCTLDGCPGYRIAIRWPSGKITYPCSKGMTRSRKGWRIL